MSKDYIEYLREASNTKVEVCFGEQSIKRKTQLQQYYTDKLILNSNKQSYIYEILSNGFFSLTNYLRITLPYQGYYVKYPDGTKIFVKN